MNPQIQAQPLNAISQRLFSHVPCNLQQQQQLIATTITIGEQYRIYLIIFAIVVHDYTAERVLAKEARNLSEWNLSESLFSAKPESFRMESFSKELFRMESFRTNLSENIF
jgi:hypothetical protein